MSWKEYIDNAVGDTKTFTNNEVRRMIKDALEYECTAWVKQTRK